MRTRTSRRGREATVIGAIGERELLATLPLEGYPGVEQVLPILKPYKLVSREISPDPTVIEVRGRRIGDDVLRADRRARARSSTASRRSRRRARSREAGATMLRGGAFKPRTSPYTFQGLGEEALDDPARGARGDRPADRDRADGSRATSRRCSSTRT